MISPMMGLLAVWLERMVEKWVAISADLKVMCVLWAAGLEGESMDMVFGDAKWSTGKEATDESGGVRDRELEGDGGERDLVEGWWRGGCGCCVVVVHGGIACAIVVMEWWSWWGSLRGLEWALWSGFTSAFVCILGHLLNVTADGFNAGFIIIIMLAILVLGLGCRWDCRGRRLKLDVLLSGVVVGCERRVFCHG